MLYNHVMLPDISGVYAKIMTCTRMIYTSIHKCSFSLDQNTGSYSLLRGAKICFEPEVDFNSVFNLQKLKRHNIGVSHKKTLRQGIVFNASFLFMMLVLIYEYTTSYGRSISTCISIMINIAYLLCFISNTTIPVIRIPAPNPPTTAPANKP